MPWITSGLAKRKVTSRSGGTTTHCGTKANCVATMRVVTWPFCSTRVPRLGSVNSPVRCRVVGSIRSRFEGGLRFRARAANSVSPKMMTTTTLTAAAQRSSERWTSYSVAAIRSPDHAAGKIDQEVDQHPGDQQKQNCRPAERNRTRRHLAQRQHLLFIEISWLRFRPIRADHLPTSVPSLARGKYPIGDRGALQPSRSNSPVY